MPSYCVEYAASNRSTCKGCKIKIEKGLLRVGIISPGPGDYDMTSWRHPACCKSPKTVADAAEIPGFSALKPDDQQAVRDWLSSGSSAGKKRAADTESIASLDPKKMKAGDLKKALQDAGIKPEGKKDEMVAALSEVTDRATLELQYNKLSAPELKALCELNKQLKGGTKAELVDRVVDGKMYGALPRCPECGGGLLKVVYSSRYGHSGQGQFSCPGFYDDDCFKRCPYAAPSANRQPWRDA